MGLALGLRLGHALRPQTLTDSWRDLPRWQAVANSTAVARPTGLDGKHDIMVHWNHAMAHVLGIHSDHAEHLNASAGATVTKGESSAFRIGREH